MKLFYEPVGLEMEIFEGDIAGLCIENLPEFRRFVGGLWERSNGLEGCIFLSNGEREIKLNKEGCVIFNPYSLDVNDKKIISRIYGEIQALLDTDLYEKQQEINGGIISLLDEVSVRFPYPLEYSLNLDFQQILKLYGVKLDMQDSELLDRVVDYIRLSHQVLGTCLFVFVQFRNYFSQEEFSKLREMVQYEQISVLLVEAVMEKENTRYGKWWIVDNDLCIIEA